MEIVKVLRGEADLERKTYIVWTLPFVILLSFVFLAEYFVFFDKIMIWIISVLGFFGTGYSMLVYLAIFFGSFAFVFILSGKRFQELDMSWYYAFLLLPFCFCLSSILPTFIFFSRKSIDGRSLSGKRKTDKMR